jgi:hypothetical protein
LGTQERVLDAISLGAGPCPKGTATPSQDAVRIVGVGEQPALAFYGLPSPSLSATASKVTLAVTR